MAVVTNTFRTSAPARANREELANVVSRITPEDTPIYSVVPKTAAKSIHPEWLIDTLAAPGDNAQEEGNDYTFGSVDSPTRPGNYTQIFRKDWIISGSQEQADEAANVNKMKYQRLKKGVELRKDVEFCIVSNNASVAGNTRRSGGLPSWLTSNTSRNSGSNGGFNQGTGLTVAETPGTQRAFTKALLDTTMQTLYNSGGTPKNLVVSPYVKSVFVTFMSDTNVASFRYAADNGQGNSIVANADFYEGPFGKVRVIPNRVMAASAAVARRAFLVDPSYAEWMWFRRIQDDKDVAKTGDAMKGVIIAEGCLKVKNEAGHGVVADLFGLTAST